jgi:hypothetical protein
MRRQLLVERHSCLSGDHRQPEVPGILIMRMRAMMQPHTIDGMTYSTQSVHIKCTICQKEPGRYCER